MLHLFEVSPEETGDDIIASDFWIGRPMQGNHHQYQPPDAQGGRESFLKCGKAYFGVSYHNLLCHDPGLTAGQ